MYDSDGLIEKRESVYARYVVDGEFYGENYLSKDYAYDAVYGWPGFMTDCAYYSGVDGNYEFDMEVVYDAEMPEGAKAFLEYDRQTENLRTITVISNPGTENEKSQSVQTPKGLLVSLSSAYDTNETFAVYADAACTEPYTSSNYSSDTTIYVKWGE